MLRLVDPLSFDPGTVPYADDADITGHEAILALVEDHAMAPDEDPEDWPDGRMIHAHLVMLDGARLVGNGMVVRDEWDAHCKLVAFALHPAYRDPHLVQLFEEALAAHDLIDSAVSYVEVSGGRRIFLPEIADLPHVC